MSHLTTRFSTIVILLLTLVGTCAAGAALWLEWHKSAIPESRYVIAGLMVAFFVSLTSALFLYLARRDQARRFAATVVSNQIDHADDSSGSHEMEGVSIYGLAVGQCYEVRQDFIDYYGNRFEAGEHLTFRQRHFLPYHGGHTVVFAEKVLYLQEEQNRQIVDEFWQYFTVSQG